MVRLGAIINIIGSIFILLGLLGPWFSWTVHYEDGTYTYSLSPFLFSIHKNSNSYMYFFHNIIESLIGVVCIVGALFGFVGYINSSGKAILIGGILGIGSAFAYTLCLPSMIEIGNGYWSPFIYNYLNVGWGELITIGGGVIMITWATVFFLKHGYL